MQGYSRLATPRFKRITLRFSWFEIELRARPQATQESTCPEERAYRRACAEQTLDCYRHRSLLLWSLKV